MQQNTYVFDLDGVITNPENSAVDSEAVDHIYNLLENGTLVAINTGRSYAWVHVNLLINLRERGGHALFDHLYIVCEKGGESLLWDGEDFRPQPSRFALSPDAISKCQQLFNDSANEFSTMFWDATKQTMATIEKLPEADLSEFHNQQVKLVELLQQAFEGHDVRIDDTTIATDVELPGAGKHAGAELIYEWAAQHIEIETTQFICFGDSKSDYAMAQYFAAQGRQTTFVFVGKKDDHLEAIDGITHARTEALYADGTNEYFSSSNQ